MKFQVYITIIYLIKKKNLEFTHIIKITECYYGEVWKEQKISFNN